MSDPARGGPAPTPRPRRGRQATRRAILAAARAAWTEGGYDEVGLREIAGRAGVTAALVNRYFGTKEALFREAIGTDDPTPLAIAEVEHEQLGQALARAMLTGRPSAAYDPVMMLLRAAPNAAAQPALRDYLETTVIPPLANHLGGQNDDAARKRAALVLALAFGSIALRRVLGVAPLASEAAPSSLAAADDELIALAAAMIQAAVDAPT